MIRIGVIGYGYWGPKLTRNFIEAPGATVAAVCDRNAGRLAAARERYPAVDVMTDGAELIGRSDVDAVVIATPVSTHFELARQALRAGKHVLVEKPLAASSGEARKLIDEAAARRLALMVDHTFIYTGSVRKIRELIGADHLGEILYFDSTRVNLGLFQPDVNVIWDLAVHDLAIMEHLLPARPHLVSATGLSHIPNGAENIAHITLFFNANTIGHVSVNWLAPVKVRQTLIGGSRKMIVYDDVEPSEKIKVYDKGISVNHDADSENVYKLLVGYRIGDVWCPNFDRTEALRTEALHFIDCVANGVTPLTGGLAGLRVVQILEAATESMRLRGQPVEIAAGE